MEQIIVRLAGVEIYAFLHAENLDGEDGGFPMAQPAFGGQQQVAHGHAALGRGVHAVVERGKRHLRARAGIHGIQIVHQRFHRLIGGAVGFLYGLFVRERLHARNIRFAHAQLRQLFALPGDEFVVLHQRGARRAGQDHIQRKIGADVRARVVHAAKQFQRAHHVVRVALHKGLAHAFGHGIIEVHDALPAVLIVLVGLDGDAGERGIAVDVPRFAQISFAGGKAVFEQAEQVDLAAGRGEGEEIHIVDMDIAIAVRLGVLGLDHAQKVELLCAFRAVFQHGAHGSVAIDIGVFALEVGIFGGTEGDVLINLH